MQAVLFLNAKLVLGIVLSFYLGAPDIIPLPPPVLNTAETEPGCYQFFPVNCSIGGTIQCDSGGVCVLVLQNGVMVSKCKNGPARGRETNNSPFVASDDVNQLPGPQEGTEGRTRNAFNWVNCGSNFDCECVNNPQAIFGLSCERENIVPILVPLWTPATDEYCHNSNF